MNLLGGKDDLILLHRKCPICCSLDYSTAFRGTIPSVTTNINHQFNLVRCNNCGTIYVNPAPSPNELMKYYPSEYYLDQNTFQKKIISSLGALSPIRSFISLSLNRKAKGKVLEIGCADGRNLEPFLRLGWQAYGVEPNERLATVARTRGIFVHLGFLDSYVASTQFDAVILSHVLEHDYDPLMMLKKVKSLLSGDGLLYVEVSILGSTSFLLFKKYWGGLEFPLHLTLFNEKTFIRLVKNIGFNIVYLKKRTLLGDSFRTMLKIVPDYKRKTKLQKVLFLASVILLQTLLLAFNTFFRKGDALAIIAKTT